MTLDDRVRAHERILRAEWAEKERANETYLEEKKKEAQRLYEQRAGEFGTELATYLPTLFLQLDGTIVADSELYLRHGFRFEFSYHGVWTIRKHVIEGTPQWTIRLAGTTSLRLSGYLSGVVTRPERTMESQLLWALTLHRMFIEDGES